MWNLKHRVNNAPCNLHILVYFVRFHVLGCLYMTDQCVDKAKVEESEQRAAEFSKKVSLLITLGASIGMQPGCCHQTFLP